MKKTLVVGANDNPERYAYKATSMLKEYHHEVVPFGIRKGEIEGIEIQNSFPESGDFDTVSLYLNPGNQQAYIDKIIHLGPKRVIFNPGTENPEFEEKLKTHGIQPIEACTLVMLRTGQF